MKNSAILLSAVLAGALMNSPVQAQDSTGGDLFVLNAVGQRDWSVSCEFTQADGDQLGMRGRGRGILHTEQLALGDVINAECRYQVPERGALQLTFDMRHTGFQCPFGAYSDGMCQIQLRAGQTGAFQVSADPVLRSARIYGQ